MIFLLFHCKDPDMVTQVCCCCFSISLLLLGWFSTSALFTSPALWWWPPSYRPSDFCRARRSMHTYIDHDEVGYFRHRIIPTSYFVPQKYIGNNHYTGGGHFSFAPKATKISHEKERDGECRRRCDSFLGFGERTHIVVTY